MSEKNIQFSIFNCGKTIQNKAQQQNSGGQKHNFPGCKKILNGIIPCSGVKVIPLGVMSGENKVGRFRHYYESNGSSSIGEIH